MTNQEIENLCREQKEFFNKGITLDLNFRREMLKKLYFAIQQEKEKIEDALKEDLGKSSYESYISEIYGVLEEIRFMLKNLKRLAKPKRVSSPATLFKAKSCKIPCPYGNVLIISPWNYPFLLSISPLVDALAAGNTVILKPSAYSIRSSKIISSILEKCFEKKYVAVVQGGREENTGLLNQNFDYMFFTGSKNVGKEVMRHAAEKLIPVTLELGGKSPCLVLHDADTAVTAKRIVFGKFLNCGQTCIAPDYIYCHSSIKDKLISNIIEEIKTQFTDNPLGNPCYGKIINQKHFNRISLLIDEDKIVYGGKREGSSLKIEPCIMDRVTFSDPVMLEEIFGPLLPVITFENTEEAMEKIRNLEKPLALYVFTRNKKEGEKIMAEIPSGGGCINDTIMHITNTNLPFGGVGESGMGSYHGEAGFNTFSHIKSVVNKSLWMDTFLRYQPYTEKKKRLLRMFLK